jgi:pilus assembly protein TadC
MFFESCVRGARLPQQSAKLPEQRPFCFLFFLKKILGFGLVVKQRRERKKEENSSFFFILLLPYFFFLFILLVILFFFFLLGFFSSC